MTNKLSRRVFGGLSMAAALCLNKTAEAAVSSDLKRHPFLLTGEWDHRWPTQTLFLVRGGKVVWSYAIPMTNPDGSGNELGDATVMANGNVLFAYKTGASEVTPDKQIVWNLKAEANTEIHTLQPVGLDRVMVVQNGNPAKLMIIHKATGVIEKELHLPVPNPDKPHIQFRRVRMTETGTFIAGHLDDHKVVEYDASGKAIWTYYIDRPWGVQRLKNGNTLISSYNAAKMTEVVEVTPAGAVIWRFSQADIPASTGYKAYQFQGVARLGNGNTVICNWCPGAVKDTSKWSDTVQVFEVKPSKKIVWALSQWGEPDLGTASSIQLLDQPDGLGISA